MKKLLFTIIVSLYILPALAQYTKSQRIRQKAKQNIDQVLARQQAVQAGKPGTDTLMWPFHRAQSIDMQYITNVNYYLHGLGQRFYTSDSIVVNGIYFFAGLYTHNPNKSSTEVLVTLHTFDVYGLPGTPLAAFKTQIDTNFNGQALSFPGVWVKGIYFITILATNSDTVSCITSGLKQGNGQYKTVFNSPLCGSSSFYWGNAWNVFSNYEDADMYMMIAPAVSYYISPVINGPKEICIEKTLNLSAKVPAYVLDPEFNNLKDSCVYWDFGDQQPVYSENIEKTFLTTSKTNASINVKVQTWTNGTAVFKNVFPIQVYDLPKITFDNTIFICNESITIKPTVSLGKPPYNYNWSNGSKAESISINNGGTYWMEVTDALGCKTIRDSIEIKEIKPPGAFYILSTNQAKVGENIVFINESINKQDCNCLTDFGDGTVLPGCDTLRHTYMAEGIYRIKLYIGKSGGCSDTFSRQVIISGISSIEKTEIKPFSVQLINDYLHIKSFSQNFANKSVIVFNSLGQRVLAENSLSPIVQIDFAPLKSGVYIIHILQNGTAYSQKVVKQ